MKHNGMFSVQLFLCSLCVCVVHVCVCVFQATDLHTNGLSKFTEGRARTTGWMEGSGKCIERGRECRVGVLFVPLRCWVLNARRAEDATNGASLEYVQSLFFFFSPFHSSCAFMLPLHIRMWKRTVPNTTEPLGVWPPFTVPLLTQCELSRFIMSLVLTDYVF